ncbi:MAG: transporter substrate-binding domain-containing protein [Clostridia bacterium]|nr:transporter substrate-binding domain-containing protein [Clostridia bacterium]
MKRIIVTLLVIAMLSLTCACAEGTFRVGMECDYPPFNWTQVEEDENSVPIEGGMGYAGGYDVEIAKQIAAGLDKELVVVKVEWDGLIQKLNAGQIDAVIAGMSPTAERKITVDFTDAYYNSDLVIVVRKDSPYAEAATLADFAGAKITGQLNTFHYTVIDQIPDVNKLPAMDTFPAMTVALSSGAIDGYISERPGAVSAVASNDAFTFVTPGFKASEEDTSIAVALKQGQPELIEQINGILAGIDADARNSLMDAAVLNQPISAE